MVLEHQFSLLDWLFPSSQGYGYFVTLFVFIPFLAMLAAFLCYLAASVRYGPGEGFYAVAQTAWDGVVDFRHFSLRRTWAMARLALQEAVRRRVLVAFVVFVLVLLFAGWFLDVKTEHPARLYIGFVLPATSYLVLLLALLLSTFSLPADVKSKTIYTVVTKPVRASEIVLGRIIGFSLIGTALLAPMCVISYFFVVRGLQHEHAIEPESVVENPAARPGSPPTFSAVTTLDAHHRHRVTIGPDGVGETEPQHDHTHLVIRRGEGEEAVYEVGPPRGMLQARVPIYGRLRFLDRRGNETDRGVNVGNVWTYRSYIEGGTLATAIWTFEGLDPGRFPDGLPLEMTLSVFRTYKGNIERRVMGELWLASADPARPMESAKIVFESQEYVTQRLFVPRKLKRVESDGSLTDIDLFDDLAPDGRVEVRIRCADPRQYFGMAQADVYIRAADASFLANFVKGYLSIWLQMVIVTAFGVMFSTFLSGPVAMLATVAAVVIGFVSQFIAGVQTGKIMGGGPVESLIRMLTQDNVMVELDIGLAVYVVKAIDFVIMLAMRAVSALLPDFGNLDTSAYVAYGFNIPDGLVVSHFVMTATYLFVVAVIGYFCLKTREIAA